MFNIIACQLFVQEQSTSTQVIQQLYKYKNHKKQNYYEKHKVNPRYIKLQ